MSTQFHLYVKELPASEEDPAQILIKSLNSSTSEFELVFEDKTGEVDKELVLDLDLPTIARAHKIELKLLLPEVGFEKVFTFNLTDDGAFVLLDGSEGLKFKQQKVAF